MHTAFLQLLKVQSEYAEITFDPNAPSSSLMPLNPNTAPSVASDSVTQSQPNAHHLTFIQPTDDWTELVMSQGSFKVESVVKETEIRSDEMPVSELLLTDGSVSDVAVDVILTEKYSDWTDTLRSHGLFRAESLVVEREKDVTLSEPVLTQMLMDYPVLEATLQNLAPYPMISDSLSPDLTCPRRVPLTGSCQNAQQTSSQNPENVHSQAGDTTVAEPQVAVSTMALTSLANSLAVFQYCFMTSPDDLEM